MKRHHARWMVVLELCIYKDKDFVRFDFRICVAKKSQEELNLLFYPHLSRMENEGQEGVLTGYGIPYL